MNIHHRLWKSILSNKWSMKNIVLILTLESAFSSCQEDISVKVDRGFSLKPYLSGRYGELKTIKQTKYK